MVNGGKLIVITAPVTETIDHAGYFIQMAIASLPIWLEKILDSKYPKWRDLERNEDGSAKYMPAGVRTVEAALLREYRAEDIACCYPDDLEKFIGPATRVVAVSTHNPLGVTFAAGVYTSIFGSSKQPINSHYSRLMFDRIRDNPHRASYKVLVGGSGGWQITQTAFFETIARNTVAYLKRDLRHKDGGFFSAEDADSLATADAAHKTEGAFYVWKAAEIDELLGKENGSIFRYAYGARRDGNARPESDPQGELKGLNTLYRAVSFKKTAEFFKKSPEEIQAIIDKGLSTLFEARAKRPHPHLDDKIIAAWNGLAIAGLARAGAAFGDAETITLAAGAAQFIHEQLCTTPGKGLHRSWREGERGPKAFAIDYACLIHGLLDLYQASFDVKWLQWATALQSEMDTLFLDTKNGGYYSVHTDMPNSVLRIKEDYDGAEPSPNSLAALNLVRLSALLAKDTWKQQAEKIFALFGSTLQSSPSSVPVMAIAFDLHHRGKQQIVLAGDSATPEFKALVKKYLPEYDKD